MGQPGADVRAIVPVIAGAAVLAVGGGSLAFAGLTSDVSLTVAGKKKTLTTTGATVGAALKAAGITPDADDQVSSPVTTTLKNGATVRFVRVDVATKTKRSDVGYTTVSQTSSKLERDKSQTK